MHTATNTVRTRFAPSPTGRLHVGNVRVALISWLFARQQDGTFVLRIEDTDAARNVPDAVDNICDDLRWLGLQWDDFGRQSNSVDTHKQLLAQLLSTGHAYRCFCTPDRLSALREQQRAAKQPPRYDGRCRQIPATAADARVANNEPFILRFRVPDGDIHWTDLIKGTQQRRCVTIDDFALTRTDGSIGFLFANAVDDAMMGITHVFRGEDHVANTPKQLLLLQALAMTPPQYGHLSLLVGADGKPLSKRNGMQAIADLRHAGYHPQAVINALARIGCDIAQATDDVSSLPLDTLAQRYSIAGISRAAARFDDTQLLYWQQQTLQHAAPAVLRDWCAAHNVVIDAPDAFWLAIRPNITTPTEAQQWYQQLYGPPVFTDDALVVLSTTPPAFFTALEQALNKPYEELVVAMRSAGFSGKQLFLPLRVVLSGTTHGPALADLYALLPNDEKRRRCRIAAQHAQRA